MEKFKPLVTLAKSVGIVVVGVILANEIQTRFLTKKTIAPATKA